MTSIYSELRKQVKAGNKKLINVSYTPEIYKIFKVLQEDRVGYEKKRYTLKHLDGSPLETEYKVNEMRKNHRYKRLFASDLLKVDKNTKPTNYTNDRANQLNLMDKLIVDKPVKMNKPKVIKDNIPIDKPVEEIRRSSRQRKERDVLDL